MRISLFKVILWSYCLFGLISSVFVNFFGITSERWILSVIFMIVFAIPSYGALVALHNKRALGTIGLLSLVALTIESIAIKTGFPYGAFHYQDGIGPKMFGLVPFAVPFAWVPLVIGAYTVARSFSLRFAIPLTALLLVVLDVVIDPGAYTMKIWIWDPPGPFYGVPLQNFAGWFGSGIVGGIIIHYFIGERILAGNKSLLITSTLGTIAFWLGIASQEFLMIPIFVGIVLLYCGIVFLKAQNQQ